MKKGLIILLTVSLLIRIILLMQPHAVWWDASIYLGMGRELYSNYQLGIWEPLRPILWPFALGFFWELGLNEILLGNLLQIMLSLGIIYFTYSIARNISKSDNDGLLAAAIISFTPIFVSFNFRLYTEIPAAFLSLLSIWLMQKNRHLSSGLMSGLAFLTKFPAGLILIGNIISSNFKETKKIVLGFLISIIPYLIYNQLKYNDFLLPIREGKYVIKYAGIWIFQQPWHFYLKEFIVQNIFYVFAIVGVFMLLKKKAAAIPVAGFALLGYLSLEPHKEPRFMILFLPYFAIMAANGISKFKIRYAPLIVGVASLLLLIPALQAEPVQSAEVTEYLNFGRNNYNGGEILSSTPRVAMAEVARVTPIYYIIFDANISRQWEGYIIKNNQNISYIFLDTCEGGIFCPPWDTQCPEARDSLVNASKRIMPYHKEIIDGSCEYHIFYKSPEIIK